MQMYRIERPAFLMDKSRQKKKYSKIQMKFASRRHYA